MVQLSHSYMTTGKTIALTIQTFVRKVISLFLNTLFRFVIAFLPRIKCLNFVAAASIHNTFGAQENKVCHCFHFFPCLFAMYLTVLNIHWKDWCWSWNSTWCEELTHLKRPWCWERLKARRKGDEGGWDGWMASLTQWTWVWVNPGSWWWTGRPSVLRSMGSQRVGHDWDTELNWTELNSINLTG